MASRCFFYLVAFIILSLATLDFSTALSPFHYDRVCPQALPTIKRIVEEVVGIEPRMGASLLRLHFHDCFVNGCDASILLDQTATIDSEKNAIPNLSVRGYEVIDRIKFEVDRICQGVVVSCADILAVAARDSVVKLGGQSLFWEVQLGRNDSTTASRTKANTDLPSPFSDLPTLITSFENQGLNVRDLVVLSGGHTIGFAQCLAFARQPQATCPGLVVNNSNLAPLDPTPGDFDTKYFSNLVEKKGLLHSDQVLFNDGLGETDALVNLYNRSSLDFSRDFGNSMIKMGNIMPLTGINGKIRFDCRQVNL